MGGFQNLMHLTNRDAGISPANAADPDPSAGALQAALLLAEVAHRAAEADVLATRAARRVLRRAAVHVHVVVAPGQGSAAVVAIGGRRARVGDAGRRGAGGGFGANVPEPVKRLLLLAVRVGVGVRVRVRSRLLLGLGDGNGGGVLRLALRPLLCRVQQVQGVLCGQA